MRLQDFLSGKNQLLNFEFVDNETINSYLEQMPSFMDKLEKDKTFKLEISVPFIKAGVEKRPPGPLSEFDKLKKVIEGLQALDQLEEGYPRAKENVTTSQFYFSSGRATRYRIPKERLAKLDVESDVFIWLMKQELKVVADGERDIIGNFAYLLQRHNRGGDYQQCYSVYSATQFLMEEVGLVRSDDDPREQRPYADLRSPEVILEDIGGERQFRRQILSCYRCRSMSDNMYIVVDGEKKRFNDLVAYPLFIASL